MPTYEYRCKDCDHEFEARQAFSDDPLTECPSCGGPVKKKFGAVGISFKGSGFYKTDSRTSSTSTSSSATTKTDADSGSSKADSSSGSGDSASSSGDGGAKSAGTSDSSSSSTSKAAVA